MAKVRSQPLYPITQHNDHGIPGNGRSPEPSKPPRRTPALAHNS
jgi:hypothetical protein